METQKVCPNCRKPLPPDVPLGLCPECLIKSGFPTESGPGVSGEAAGARFTPPPVEEIARLFPQLEILGLIGQGGMGAVYKARQPALDRMVALKVLPPAVAGDPGFAERFNREARALARLNHPNIVAVHDFGQAGPLHFLVMEFVDGANLREVERAGRLSAEQALAIVPQICEALNFAHNEGIVHRDIKPENLLMDKKGRVKITDFGIAKIVGLPAGKISLTGARDVVGTPHYMAPEQIEKPQSVDHRADIYSLGVVFYEMLTGELPLGKFQPPSQRVQVDVRLDEVVLHALEKEPSRRYQQASQVKTDVETIAGTPPTTARFAPTGGIANPTSKSTSDKINLPAFLLAFCFGVFGAHRFYVGKIWTGCVQLGALFGCVLMIIACATTGARFEPTLGILLGVSIFGCLTWATIDWILILCKAFTDGQGRRMTHWLHPQTGDVKTPVNPMTGPPSNPPPGGAASSASAGPNPPPLAPGRTPAQGTGMIVAPAVGLMVAAGWMFFSGLRALLFLPTASWLESFLDDLDLGSIPHWKAMAGITVVLFKVIPAGLIFFGGLRMVQLRSHAWAIAAGILAILSCSLVGFPVGIWALIILARQDVREIFAQAATTPSPKSSKWPWIAVTVAAAGVMIVGLLVAAVLALSPADTKPNLTVRGTVTDAVTGRPIAGARVDDNRYGADSGKAPQQAWTDAKGHYKLNTWYEEHAIAATAPGYETKMSTLLTKALGSEREKRMDFQLQPQIGAPALAATGTRVSSTPKMAIPMPVPLEHAAPGQPPIRIKAGASEPFTDSEGNLWLADQGFADGENSEPSGVLAIVNTKDPGLYQTEKYGMTSFAYPVPNGKYMVKLHFAEIYNAITGPGERVFTYVVEGHEFKDFDVWARAGGAQRACVETVNVEVTDGKLNINFIPQTQNPEINGIEILPAPAAGPGQTGGNALVVPAAHDASSKTFKMSSPNGQLVIETDAKGNTTLTGSKMDSVVTPTPPAPPAPPATAATLSQPRVEQTKIIGSFWTKDAYQQDFSQTLPLTANGRLTFDNVNGRIELTGWDRNELSIQAVKHGKTSEGVEAVEIVVDAHPDHITVHTKQPSSWFGGKKDDVNVDYTVRVPRHARLSGIASVNGRIVIQGIAGNIEASTVNGETHVADAAGDLKLSTVNGRIEAELTMLGSGQSVAFSTVNGQIEATLPAQANARVTASTVNGGISSDFPSLTIKKEFPLGRNLKGTLGNGGASVQATTVNGGIRFRKGE